MSYQDLYAFPGKNLIRLLGHHNYGLEVLEVVPNDPRSPAYRLLGARLYNAGLRVRTLEGVFGLDR